jgi:pyruvate dehydrogenase E2 component (dihydrolipoamide acetyltransferase)
MATNVILPALGMSQDSGQIVQWLKAKGDQVEQGEPIAEIQTDKATVELEAPASGTLAHISAEVGDEVPVGHIIAVILAAGETAPSLEEAEMGAATGESVTTASVEGPGDGDGNNGFVAPLPEESAGRIPPASPKARRLAAERRVDLKLVEGSGPGGAVLAADISSRPAERELGDFSRAWRLVAERTTESWRSIPHFFLMREVSAQPLVDWRGRASSIVAEKLTLTDLLIKITALALRRHPRLNASLKGSTLISNPDVNVGFAVALPDGLPVPVIVHADELGLDAIAGQRKALVERAQSGKLRPEDLEGGTFTISNLGMYGVDAFHAIINAPQVAILSVGTLVDRIVPVRGLPAVVPMLTLGLSCDHRVVDGARGAEFLATIAELIANSTVF